MKLTVKDVAHILTRDIDPTKQEDVQRLDGFVNQCISAAEAALREQPIAGYSDLEMGHLIGVVNGLRHSHSTIRYLLLDGYAKARAVDALAVARLQLETLYSTCLMLQGVEHLRTFAKSHWKKVYIRFLLERQECGNLPRFAQYINVDAMPLIDTLQQMSGVTAGEKLTVEHEELGTPLPVGFHPEKINRFPTPMGVIDAVTDNSQKEMLKRLYPEYQYLCSFAHGSAEAWMLKELLDERSIYRKQLTTGQIEDRFQRAVGEPAILYSVISCVQTAAELTARCPNNLELLAKVTEAWTWLTEGSLLARALWERRTGSLLKIVGC